MSQDSFDAASRDARAESSREARAAGVSVDPLASAPAEGTRGDMSPELAEFLEYMRQVLQESPRATGNTTHAAARPHYRLRRFAMSMAALALMAAAFHAGQRLPTETCRQAFERVSRAVRLQLTNGPDEPDDRPARPGLGPAPTETGEFPASLRPLEHEWCWHCGRRLWPLMNPDESCPHCGAADAIGDGHEDRGQFARSAGSDGIVEQGVIDGSDGSLP
jgi:hypothetical protein